MTSKRHAAFRRLLVPVNGHKEEGVALAGAFEIARVFNSHVVALFAQVDPFGEIAHAGIDSVGVAIGGMMEHAKKTSD